MIKLSNAKAINVFRDGAWQNQKMGYVYFQGKWISLIEYTKHIFYDGEILVPLENYVIEGETKLKDIEIDDGKSIVTDFYGGGGSNWNHQALVITENYIDVTEFSKLHIDVSFTISSRTQGGYAEIGLIKNKNITGSVVDVGERISTNNTTEVPRKLYTIDITDVVGDFYLKCVLNSSHSYKYTMNIYEITLE